jgi:phosphotransferase system HPr-like phosphotransfer protein
MAFGKAISFGLAADDHRERAGLACASAAEFVRRASGFRSEIWLVKDGKRFSATS